MTAVTTHQAAHGTGRHRRRPELAAFLRNRRARVTPADVGMAPGLRRRTPGLRREEVAQLSGVGVTWYTWLEQGRPINASPQVLDAVARTLRLDASEREHLYHLAEVACAPGRQSDAIEVGPEIQGIIDALDPHPAVVYNARYDILATNPAYRDLFAVPDMVGTGIRNVLWTLFTVSEEACPVVHRAQELPIMVATLRGAYGRHTGELTWESFVEQLDRQPVLRRAVAQRGCRPARPPGEDLPALGGGRGDTDDLGVAVRQRAAGVPDRGVHPGRRGERGAGRRVALNAGRDEREDPAPCRGRDLDCGAKEN